ncbi:MAG TPA: galactose ABC transporter substrate-binding protein [Rectinemataceae bacterium]|nr:galactose ABC transporter substrate-binding protein [Rectinemataceae bacterium]
MKRIVLLLSVLAAVALLASCGPAKPKKPNIGITIYKFDDNFMSIVRNKIDTLAKAVGADKLDYSIQDGQGDQSKQNDLIDQFLTKGATALALNMVEPASASVVIGKAQAKKVPIVFFNREPDAAEMAKDPIAYYVGAKAQQSGTYEGEIIADYWKAHPEADRNKDGKLQYVMLLGDPANTDAKYRTEFSIKAVEAAGITVDKLAEDTAMWQTGEAQNKMQAWLSKFGNKIEVVFANNDAMALGAINALKAAGYFKGNKYMPVVGVDAIPEALDALEQGTLLGTVLNDADRQGQATFDLAYSLAQGKPAATDVAQLADADGNAAQNGHYIWVPYVKVTKDNYKQFKK